VTRISLVEFAALVDAANIDVGNYELADIERKST
jgi:hypothetical protein